MCTECGCGVREDGHQHDHDTHHHRHGHRHDDVRDTRTIEVLRGILDKNDHLAAHLRDDFGRHGVFAANLVSSPGAGKTELLHRTMVELGRDARCAAVTGDLATENDATRLASSGSPAKQILTGTMCHLEADMVSEAISGWDLADLDYVFIENVGNLVCPGEFDLGEDVRVVVLSVTEGEDKPLKYPTLLHTADVVVISKVDLVEPIECDLDLLTRNVREVRPGIDVMPLSAKSGKGLDAWFAYLRRSRDDKLQRNTEPLRAAG